MNKLIRHSWIKQDGFRVYKCKHCGCIRRWNDGWKQLIYTRGTEFYLRTPSCKRIMHCDKIDLNEIGTDWNNGEFYK